MIKDNRVQGFLKTPASEPQTAKQDFSKVYSLFTVPAAPLTPQAGPIISGIQLKGQAGHTALLDQQTAIKTKAGSLKDGALSSFHAANAAVEKKLANLESGLIDMRVLIMANGEYGDLEWYRDRATSFDRIICADGGTAWARRLGLKPDRVIGDLDSVTPEDLEYTEQCASVVERYPAAKDDTDTQLALKWVLQQETTEAVIWGGLGRRLDHTLSNLYSASILTRAGIKVVFEQPGCAVYLVSDRLVLKGAQGHIVSLIVLGDKAGGVTLTGFQYPLNNAELTGGWQYAISNVVLAEEATISLCRGILAVFDYAGPV